jgi:phage shock protein PspC (stress-responsive transcriptional regulator)
MNKVITINLNGNAYQLEESGYDALRQYLDNAARRLEGNPDKDEIIADIEQAIADKFRAVLGTFKTVVVTREVEKVIEEMGPVQDASGDTGEPAPDGANAHPSGNAGATVGSRAANSGSSSTGTAKRLYRINEGAMIAGVCNGLAAYFNIDVTIVRLLFAILTLLWGTGILVYVLMAFIVPTASTPTEMAAAQGGGPSTTQEFIRRARAGYYEGMKTFHDKHAHREWKRKFKREMRGWKYNFQREMHQNAHQWQQNWSQHWGQHPHPRAWIGLGFTLMVLKWVKLLCFCFGIYAVYSLVTKGSVFGVLLPAGIPVWIGVVFLIVLYHFVTWPIKAMQYGCYYPGTPRWGYGPMSGPLDGLVWLGFIVVLVWLGDHYVPQVHEALLNLPPAVHHAMDDLKQWWARQ